jgi:hypothetical protein
LFNPEEEKNQMSDVIVFQLGPDKGIAGSIINHFAPDAPEEVKKAMAAYAMGNPGAARVLSHVCANFKTAEEVEDLVGWPLSEHSLNRTGEIWDRFRNQLPTE